MGTNAPRPYSEYYDTNHRPLPPKPPHGRILRESIFFDGICPTCGSSIEISYKFVWKLLFIEKIIKCIHPECDYRR